MAEKQEIKLTEQQQQAISCRNKQLIVSAAAGSGKTAVLAKRVLDLICDPNHPCNVDRLLIMTFTKAAAAEMRGRIADELGERLSRQPGDRNLRRQLALLPQARIQTVHSFCQSLLRQHFHLCNVSPDFRQGDEIEFTRLKQLAMEQLLEEAYAAAEPDFMALADLLSDQRSDQPLENTVLEIYEKLRSHPAPAQWLELIPVQLSGDPETAAWHRLLREDAAARVLETRALLAEGLVRMELDEKLLAAYGPSFSVAFETCTAFLQALDLSWDAAAGVMQQLNLPGLSSKRSDDKELREEMKALYNRCKKSLQDLQSGSFAMTMDQIRVECAQQAPMVAALCRLVQRFTELYGAEKQQRNLLDFSDLEHKALALLTESDGSPSPVALELRRELAEVLVDEYQDTNEIQERIFAALMPETGSAFFVGDVKQSIYRFRLADPSIFRSRYQESGPYGSDDPRWRMELNRNFRSRPEVLHLCNFIFSRVMSSRFGDVDYDEGQRLVPGKPAEGCVESELLLLTGKDSEERMGESEARLVAARIRQLLEQPCPDGSLYRPEDFAILFSSYRSRAPIYENALRKLGIPCSGAERDGFFDSIEISVLLSLLRIIDNRRQDIPLISVLRSPLYFFSADALGRIRLAAPGGSICDGLEAMAATDEACADVLADLDALCALAEDSTVAQLIQEIYRRTGAPGLFAALDGGARRRENLHQLYQLALGFESGGTRGLHAFLRYVDGKIAAEESPAAAETTGGVQMMSIHRSKGLEFPVVFLPDLNKRFNVDDLKKPALFHQNVGIGLPCRDAALRVRYKTLLQRVITQKEQQELRAEELRKLYVAMTRAKEKLVMVIARPKAEAHLNDLAINARDGILSPQRMQEQTCAADWVLSALLTHPAADQLRGACTGAFHCAPAGEETAGLVCRILQVENIPELDKYDPVRAATVQIDREEAAALLQQTKKQYAHMAAAELPSKLTPTGAAKRLPESATAAGDVRQVHIRLWEEPPLAREDALLRGTAFHRALECLTPADGADEETLVRALDALVTQGRLTAEQHMLLQPSQLLTFLQSPLAARIDAALQVLREYEFAALISADQILHNGVADEVLLNGAIDLLMEEPDGLVIVDFKTDRVARDAAEAQAQHHDLQLRLYALAAEAIFQKPVKERWIWFLRLGCGIRLD